MPAINLPWLATLTEYRFINHAPLACMCIYLSIVHNKALSHAARAMDNHQFSMKVLSLDGSGWVTWGKPQTQEEDVVKDAKSAA